MEVKFNKYFKEFPTIFFFGAIMDPRIKMRGCKFLLKQFYKRMNYADNHCEKWKEIEASLEKLYEHYESQYGNKQATPSQPSQRSRTTLWDNVISESKKARTDTSLNELHYYNRAPVPDMNTNEFFDILGWWKAQASTYPVLSIIARDLLTPPASTVASESAFSSGGRVLTDRRNRLASETVEMSICLKDWLDAEKRKQDTPNEDMLEESPDDEECS